MEHKTRFNRIQKGKEESTLPHLHASFEKFGFNNHKFDLLFEDETISRNALKKIETIFIKTYKETNLSLNKRL